MQYKKSFLQKYSFLDKKAVEKKLTNNLFYNKSIIRGEILNKKIKLIDSYDDYFFEDNLKNPVGSTLNSFLYLFKHKLNPILSFKLNTYTFNKVSLNYINSLEKSLVSLLLLENKFNSLYIIKPLKSGFFCYSTGFCGFSPYTNILAASKLLENFNTFSYFTNLNFKSFIIFRFFFNSIKIIITSQSLTYKFSKKKNKKPRYNSFNLIFYSKPSI